VKLEHGKPGWAVWLGSACIVLLLVATMAQTVHFCGLPAVGSSGAAQFCSASSGSALCLTCLMAQSAAAALFFIILFPAWRRRVAERHRPVRPRAFLDCFHLYVRPPPTC